MLIEQEDNHDKSAEATILVFGRQQKDFKLDSSTRLQATHAHEDGCVELLLGANGLVLRDGHCYPMESHVALEPRCATSTRLSRIIVNPIILGWVSSTCGQTEEKKASALAIVNACANISFIWTPYLWPKTDAPRYTIAMSSSAAFSVATAMGALAMKTWLKKLNTKIRQSNGESILAFAH